MFSDIVSHNLYLIFHSKFMAKRALNVTFEDLYYNIKKDIWFGNFWKIYYNRMWIAVQEVDGFSLLYRIFFQKYF